MLRYYYVIVKKLLMNRTVLVESHFLYLNGTFIYKICDYSFVGTKKMILLK